MPFIGDGGSGSAGGGVGNLLGGIGGQALGGIMGVGGLLSSFFGGNQQNNNWNNLINYAHGAGNNLQSFIGGSTLPGGQMPAMYNASTYPLLDYGSGMLANNWALNNIQGGYGAGQNRLDQFSQYMLPGMMQGSDPMQNPYFANNFYPGLDAATQRYNSLIDQGQGNFNNFGANPGSDNIFGFAGGMMNGQNPYVQSGLDIGNWYMQNGGQTPYNQNVLDRANYGINNAGWTPQMSGAMDFFGGAAANPYTQSIMGGQQQGSGLMNLGAQMAGQYGGQGMGAASGLMQQGQGMAQYGQGMGGYGQGLTNNAIGGMNQFLNWNPEQGLGPRGSAALDSLAASPYISGAYNTTQGYLGQGTQNMGMSPQGQYNWQESLPRAFGMVDQSNGQMNDAWSTAMNAAQGGGNDTLPDWFTAFAQNAPGFGANGFGGGGGFGSISAGGGGGGASAGAMSRDLGPVDPMVQENLAKALEMFNNNPLMSMNQVVNFARDSAGTAAKGQAEAIARRAVNLGGQGPIGYGGQNQMYADFADQALQAEATQVREAMLGQQGLQLQRTGQASQLAQALQGAKSQREGLFANMNIADAGNQTQASVANSNAAESAAGRALQAQIANASNQQAMAQLQAGVYNNLLNNATSLRGQNVSQTLQGMQLLPELQNSMTQRQGQLFNNANNAQNNATQQYLGTLGLVPQLNATANTDISRWNSLINPLVAGQQTGTDRANTLGNLANTGANFASTGAQYGNVGANFSGSGANLMGNTIGSISGAGANLAGTGAGLYGNMENNASNRFSTATGGMNNTVNAANNNLGNYINMFGAGDNSAMNRLTFGANSVNNMTGRQLDAGSLYGNNNQANLNYAWGSSLYLLESAFHSFWTASNAEALE